MFALAGVPVRRFERIAAWLVHVSGRASVAAEITTVEAMSTTGADTADLDFWRVPRKGESPSRST